MLSTIPSNLMGSNVIGIDVGGIKKGFHAVHLKDVKIVSIFHHKDPLILGKWVQSKKPSIVAVDSPSGWSSNRRSREAERTLRFKDKHIPCFCTPTKAIAKKSSFYDWVFNGEKLYKVLKKLNIETYETYPHGITEMIINLEGDGSKIERRRKAVKKLGLTLIEHENIDFIDAALCSLTAHAKLTNEVVCFGNKKEGYILLPKQDYFNKRCISL